MDGRRVRGIECRNVLTFVGSEGHGEGRRRRFQCRRTSRGGSPVGHAFGIVLLLLVPANARDAICPPYQTQLECADSLLAQGRTNVQQFHISVSLAELLQRYPADRVKLQQALEFFEANKDVFGQEERARSGFVEAITWLLKGQALLGNDHLQNALGALRYPSGGGSASLDEEIAELDRALVEYEGGTSYIDRYVVAPECFALANLKALNRVLFRKTRARLERADRLFAQGIRSPTKRRRAEEELRRAVQESYLGAVVMSAFESEDDFQAIGIQRLRPNALQGQTSFARVASGLDPIGLHRDFTPFLPYHDCNMDRSLRDIADHASSTSQDEDGAGYWDAQARLTSREVDRNEDALRSNLRELRRTVIAELDDLSGALTATYFPNGANLEDTAKINQFLLASRTSVGRLAQSAEDLNGAVAAFDAAYLAMQNIPRKIAIEQERVHQTAEILFDTGEQIGANEAAIAFMSSFSVSVGLTGPSVSYNPFAGQIAALTEENELLRTMQQIQVLNIDSAATIKLYMLELAERAVALRELEARIRQASLVLDSHEQRIRSLLDEYKQTLEDNATAFYNDPGYRLEMEFAVERAHESLRNAQRQSFLACRALGYDWSNDFTGAVLPPPGNRFDDCETVLELNNASDVRLFFNALKQWATYNFTHICTRQGTSQQTISVRQDILGFKDRDDQGTFYPQYVRVENIRKFKDFIRQHKIAGVISYTFSTSIAGEQEFPIWLSGHPPDVTDYANVKIHGIAANLSGSAIGGQSFGRVSLTLGGTSTVRSCDAQWFPGLEQNDSLVHYDLEDISPERAKRTISVDASLRGFPAVPQFNTGLSRLSVAATQWTIDISTTAPPNNTINFGNLEDIQLKIEYRYGEPPAYECQP